MTKRNNINRNEILNKIQVKNGLPLSFSEDVFNYIIDLIKEGLLKDGRVKITKFGTFKILNKNKRIGRNPKNKIKYIISSRKVVVFSPSKFVKIELNGKK